MGVVEDFGTYLAAAGIGLTQATNLFLHEMPDTPNECVALHQYAGEPPVLAMGTAVGAQVFERPRVNVRVRSSGNAAAKALADLVYGKLHAAHGAASLSATYEWIAALQSVMYLEIDQNERPIFGFNVEVVKR